MSTEWTESRRASLVALCDCTFPSLEQSPDEHGFWARKASDFGIDLALMNVIDTAMPEPARVGLVGLIDALGAHGIASLPQEGREALVTAVAASSPEAGAGVVALQRIILALAYALPDAQGQNPNWAAIGYPGPRRAAQPAEKRIRPLVIDRDDEVLTADVCVVGSGAGGGVIAGELTRRGLDVIVLEAGGYYTPSDFNQLELWANQNLYWRGGYQPTADNTVQIAAGSTLGGGTTVNWQNCVRTPSWVREEWAHDFGIEQLDGPDFDKHLDGVLERLHVNDRCSDLNEPHLRLQEGTQKLGYAFKRTFRNVDPAKYDPEVAGYIGFGDVTGSRRGTLETYLEAAHRAGARILVRTRAQRILVSAGRASGVEAVTTGSDGKPRKLTVRARVVVAACGALETPALLLRSGIGGPATGKNLHLHPVVSLSGMYDGPQRAWWGPPQSALCDEFTRLEGNHGFLIECTHHSTAVPATAFTWSSGQQHKQLMSEVSRYAIFLAIIRDHGAGQIVLDPAGEAVPYYPIHDPRDIAIYQRAVREMALIHQAAGASRMIGLARGAMQVWNRGDDLDTFLADTAGRQGEWPNAQMFSAHQMGSARMGRDPQTSVATPTGELHDTKGVFIGDTSAFPTALGVNPMITCMALASRTAGFIE